VRHLYQPAVNAVARVIRVWCRLASATATHSPRSVILLHFIGQQNNLSLFEGAITHIPSHLKISLSGKREVTFVELVAKPTRRRVAANQVCKKRIFCVARCVEAKAAIRSAALECASVFNKNAASESGKLNEHGKLLSGDGRNCPLPELLCSFPCPTYIGDNPPRQAEKSFIAAIILPPFALAGAVEDAAILTIEVEAFGLYLVHAKVFFPR
jgi:hypothetical protein